jgi:hypothetical protein
MHANCAYATSARAKPGSNFFAAGATDPGDHNNNIEHSSPSSLGGNVHATTLLILAHQF